MVRQLCLWAVLLAVLLVIGGDVQAQTGSLYQQPQGELYQRPDGTYGYIVSPDDRIGQWQVAFGSPQLWLELVAVNPQLADPDRIYPGDELNVPVSLVRLFNMMDAANHNRSYTEPITGIGSTNPAPAQVEATQTNHFPYWLVWLLSAALIAFLVYRYARSRERTARDRFYATRERGWAKQADEARQREDERVLADPYSGPPVRENGIPTAEAATQFFAETYRSQREGMTVAASRALPPMVAIDRIVPVDVMGPMMVDYATGPERRVLTRWTPAWQCFLSDGSFRIALMACANDVRGGRGGQVLPETQIRPRQDVPETVVNRQIWPEIAPAAPAEVPAEMLAAAQVPLEFTSVKFDGPQRLVLQPGGQVLDFGHLIARGVRIFASVQNGEVIIDCNGQRVVFGRITGELPAILAGTNGSSATSASGPSREQEVTEILAAAGESRS